VIHAHEKISKMLQSDEQLQRQLKEITGLIRGS
jgi:chromosomal replication initiator protein